MREEIVLRKQSKFAKRAKTWIVFLYLLFFDTTENRAYNYHRQLIAPNSPALAKRISSRYLLNISQSKQEKSVFGIKEFLSYFHIGSRLVLYFLFLASYIFRPKSAKCSDRSILFAFSSCKNQRSFRRWFERKEGSGFGVLKTLLISRASFRWRR